MGSNHHHSVSLDEKVPFSAKAKKQILMLILAGVALFVIGFFILQSGGGHGHEHAAAEGAAHHGSPIWVKRILKDLWQNNVFFGGMALIGVFFIAFNRVAWAGWSAQLIRIPEAMGNYLFVYAGLTIVLLLVGGHDLFHWMDHDLFDPNSPKFDKIIKSKEWWLNIPFFYGRVIGYFALWIGLWWLIRKNSLKEDEIGGTAQYDKMIVICAFFLIAFGVTSSTSAWDFIMGMDPHFFSTMFGWYTLASLLVSGVSFIAFAAATLKDHGYLQGVNENHFHDLGKFMFGFSIFWTYVWFEQLLLIYYTNIPEESYWFIERMLNPTYRVVFFATFVLNFILPFLLLMTRGAKRQRLILKVVAVIIIIGHWFDFYIMMTPAVLHNDGQFDINILFLELGSILIFLGVFLYMFMSALTKAPLIAKNHPMIQESLHHDVF